MSSLFYPLSYPQHLFTEIENLGLMFKASAQLLGRLPDTLVVVVDVISVSRLCHPLPVSVTLPEYIFSPTRSVASLSLNFDNFVAYNS